MRAAGAPPRPARPRAWPAAPGLSRRPPTAPARPNWRAAGEHGSADPQADCARSTEKPTFPPGIELLTPLTLATELVANTSSLWAISNRVRRRRTQTDSIPSHLTVKCHRDWSTTIRDG